MSTGNDTEGPSSEWSMFNPIGGNLPYDMLGGPKFIAAFPYTAWAYLVICGVATIMGVGGNILVMISFYINKQLQRARNVFIFNLAIADMLVTGLADPFSIVGIVNGKAYFDSRPGLCSTLAVTCFVACVAVLLSIGGISFNRYLNIVYPQLYHKVFGLKKNIAMCITFWCLGILIASCTLWWSANVYDRKHLECIWDRTRSLSFTIFFSGGVIFTPIMIITFSYIAIFRHVRASKRKIAGEGRQKNKQLDGSLKLAKTLFLIFSFFAFCWTPYALIVLIDVNDRAPLEAHMFVVLLAHLHSTANCVIYYVTNSHFKASYRQIVTAMSCGAVKFHPSRSDETTGGTSNTGQSTVISVVPATKGGKPVIQDDD